MGRLSKIAKGYWGLAFTIVAACALPNDSPESRAKAIAIDYLKEAGDDSYERESTVEDAGDDWLVRFHVPEGWAGGDMLVWVDKKTMKVEMMRGGQ